MFSFSSTLTALTLAVAASAHFTLDYPQTRGFDEDTEPKFCGGFSDPSANRSQYPLGDGLLVIDSHHPTASVLVTISINDDPTSFDQFNASTNAGNAGTVLPFFRVDGEGIHCFATNLESLGIANAKDGASATIQIQFNGGDDDLFQCTDVVLSSSAKAATQSQCASIVPAPSASSSSSSTTSTSTSGASPTPTQSQSGSGVQMVPGALWASVAIFGAVFAL